LNFPGKDHETDRHSSAKATFIQTDNEVKVRGENFEYTFNKNLGALASMVVDGKEMLNLFFGECLACPYGK